MSASERRFSIAARLAAVASIVASTACSPATVSIRGEIAHPVTIDGWPLTINDELVHVHHQAISASGIRKRDHIVDPRTGQPVRERAPVWLTLDAEGETSPCAVTEAYSTAFLILPDNRRDPKGAVIPLRKTPCVQDSPSN